MARRRTGDATDTGPSVDTIPCGVISFLDDGTVTAINATLLDTLGLTSGDVVGRHVETILAIGSRIFYQTHVFPLLRLRHRADELFVLLRAADGTDIGAVLTAVRQERAGRFVTDGVLSFSRERRKFEDALVRARKDADEARALAETQAAEIESQAEELKLQVEESTALAEQVELTNEELQVANTELAERIIEVEDTARALRESEARFRFLAEAIPVQVWTATPDGRLDFLTEHAAEYFGRPVTELLGHGWASGLHPDDRARAFDRWTQSLRTGVPYEIEFRLLRAMDDTYRWHLARALPSADENGQIIQWVGSNTDIEERRRLESATAQALAESEHARVSEHTLHEAHERFVQMLSHELRTPVGAIGGYAELLLMNLRGTLTEPQRVDVERIQRNQRHLRRLIDDLLLLAKLESGQLPLDCRPVRLLDVIADAHTMVAPQLAQKSLAYRVAIADSNFEVIADRDRLQQVLINLLANAIKFTEANGSITVTADTTAADAEIRVVDTGCGIPVDKLDRIFEPFVQVDAAGGKAPGSTGLGLPISREFARRMAGDLTVESRLGEGATFILRLPSA